MEFSKTYRVSRFMKFSVYVHDLLKALSLILRRQYEVFKGIIDILIENFDR